MPSLLGKRKSRATVEDPGAIADAQELLRQHFEARFKPLPGAAAAPRAAPKKTANNDSDGDDIDASQDDDDSDSNADQSDVEWGGVSDEDDEDEEGMHWFPWPCDTGPRLRQDRHRNTRRRGDRPHINRLNHDCGNEQT